MWLVIQQSDNSVVCGTPAGQDLVSFERAGSVSSIGWNSSVRDGSLPWVTRVALPRLQRSNVRFTMPAWGGQKPLIFKDVLESALESDLERIASDLSTCNGMEVKISTDDGRHERVDITDSNAEVS